MLAHGAEESQIGTLSTMHLGSMRQGPGRRVLAAGKEQPLLERAKAAVAESPHYVVLDFRRVHGLDATAARTFGTLASTLAVMGVQLIVTQARHSRLSWLEALPDACQRRMFPMLRMHLHASLFVQSQP